MSTLLALDPGYAGTGYGVFRVPAAAPPVLQGYGPLLLEAGTWYPPRGSIDARSAWLVREAVALLSRWSGPYRVVIEVHAVAQQYARHRSRDRSGRGHMNVESVAKNRELCGWLAGGLCGVAEVRRVPAVSAKSRRSALVTDIWPHLATGHASSHARDAVYLGLRTLLSLPSLTGRDGAQ